MNSYVEALLALFLITQLMLAASSRLLHCIRIVAGQGIILGILPLLVYGQNHHIEGFIIAFVNIAVKGIALPYLFAMAMRKADVKRELEPLIGYFSSVVIVLIFVGLSFWLSGKLPLPDGSVNNVMPIAISGMLTGLFIVMARRKAITQAIGFLSFENGISLFGVGMAVECGLLVELGILLDVFALIFIMGIAVLKINRQFEHIDSDKLNLLADTNDSKSSK
jgi:hydrogenase-4 component E